MAEQFMDLTADASGEDAQRASDFADSPDGQPPRLGQNTPDEHLSGPWCVWQVIRPARRVCSPTVVP